ncbi:SemiSWEET family sugar transporter [Vitreimonas flagellata]|uniref:SemiSWEET family sugar transporter n=1 Tax=Vitreimonas flagellata TaxID=2560861 RepID=UPI001074D47F|nr:SemiSWEET family transporter [Vitreimonas flagellata]
MQSDSVEVLGLIAGFIGAFAFAPQAFKIIRDRDANGVSSLTYAMVLSGAVLWAAYGMCRGAPSIILWNVVAASLAALVLILKLSRRPKPSA